MTNTTQTTQQPATDAREGVINQIIDAVEAAAIGRLEDSVADGHEGYTYVTVMPDGEVVSGRGTSKVVGEAEYYGRRPHPITVWEISGHDEPHPDLDRDDVGDARDEVINTLANEEWDLVRDEVVARIRRWADDNLDVEAAAARYGIGVEAQG
jgi:hypothetical protein